MRQSLEDIKKWSQSLYYASWLVSIGVLISLAMTIAWSLVDAWQAEAVKARSLLIPLVWLVPMPALYFGLSHLRQLLLRFQDGEIFSETNAKHIRSIGRNVWYGMAAFLIVMPSFLSWLSKSRFRFHIEISDLLVLLLGSILFVLGWVMTQAIRIKTENESIV